MKGLRPALILLLSTAAVCAAEAPTTTQTASTMASASQPATTPSAAVSPAAAEMLVKLAAAYATPQPMQFAGTIVGDFDVAGRARQYRLDVTGRTDGNGRFWHYGRDTGLIVSDGAHGFLYDQHRNTYAELQVTPAHTGRPAPADLDPAVCDVLLDENPALLLTLTPDAAALLRRLARSITLSDDHTLVIATETKRITFDLDLATFAMHRSTIDYTPVFRQRGAAGVKSVRATLTYTSAAFAPATDSYTWSPPATASQSMLHPETARPADSARESVQIPPKK